MPKYFAAFAVPALLFAAAPAMAAEPAPAAQAPADPARLAAARRTVDYVFPLGTYARIMDGTMDQLMDSIMESVSRMPLKELAGIGGVDTEKLGSASLAEIMEIYDPAYEARMKISTRTMMGEMTALMTGFEPEIREGLTQAYAAKFDARQLGELNAFFATPTGATYAADSYLTMMSPEVMTKMQAFMPRMMQQMPGIAEKVKAAAADLPKPRQYADLSKAEKGRLAKLLGITEAKLENQEAARAARAE